MEIKLLVRLSKMEYNALITPISKGPHISPRTNRKNLNSTVIDVFLNLRVRNVAKKDNSQLSVDYLSISHLSVKYI